MKIKWNTIEFLSLDIFDTLLFRAVARPEGIFPIVWEKAIEKKIKKIDITATEYQKFRIEMERRARGKEKNREVFFRDIFNEMPDYIAWDKESLAQLEFDIEKEYCYVNKEILEVIQEARGKGIKVVLTSDMYFTKEEILKILVYNKIDTGLFDEIFISCEYRCNKQNGELYDILLKKYDIIDNNSVLHVGDNRNSDYANALAKGLQAIHYDVIPEKMYGIYDYEKIRHDSPLPQLLSLRKAAGYGSMQNDGKDKTAYEIGAGVIGPFLTLYVSWVVDRMLELGISRIYPLMREGYLLGELLKKEAENRNIEVKIEVKPIYISRKVTYIPSIQRINREEIENMIGARNLTIKEAIVLMGLKTDAFKEFAPYYDVKLKESHEIPFKTDTLKEAFIKEMLLPLRVKEMEAFIKEQRMLLNEYLKQEIGDFKNAATIDIGFFGRIQMWLEQSLQKDNIETDMTHFLAIGITGDKIYNGYHFEGYTSTTTENGDLVATIHRTTDVLEKLISVTEGSTIGYTRIPDNNITTQVEKIAPIKGKAVQNPILQKVFEGIFAFQQKWFDYRYQKPELAKQCVDNRREALMILHRLIDMPRKAEAELFTTVQADTNFGTTYAESVITKENIELLEQKGVDYIDKCNVSYTYENSNIVWPKGLITLQDEFYYVRKVLKEKSQNEIMKSMQEVVERVKADGVKAVALYGAGENGRQFLFLCRLYGIHVNCFIDRKESLWGTQKEGIPVMGLNEAVLNGSRAFIITSLYSISEIKKYIMDQFIKSKMKEQIYSV